MKELGDDYHVLTLQDNEIETTRFECYNSPHEPEKLEEVTRLTTLSIERCLRNEEENRLRELEMNKPLLVFEAPIQQEVVMVTTQEIS